LEAWGFRNPYGIGIDPFNPTKLSATVPVVWTASGEE